MLSCKTSSRHHTGDLITSELTKVHEQWSLVQEELHVITDSSTKVKKAISLMPGVIRWPCLQLCVNGALASRQLTDLPKILSTAWSIVSHIRRSPLATSQLAKTQDQLGLPHHTRCSKTVQHVTLELLLTVHRRLPV